MRWTAILFTAVLVLLCSAQAFGDSYFLNLVGSGGLMLNGADYTGTILSGMDGTWTLDVDDSMWPDESDSTARFDYIWNTYFAPNYDSAPGGENWRGFFDAGTLPSAPLLTLDTTTPGGLLVMNAPFVVQVRDYNGDGQLSQYEKHHTCQVSFTMSVETPLCTGSFNDYCGDGSGSTGFFNFVNPPDADELELFPVQLDVWYCGAPVEEGSWGTLKALYR